MSAPPSWLSRPWHVVLSPAVPVLALLSNNVSTMPFLVAILPFLLGVAAALLGWLVLGLAVRNSRTAALVTTIMMLSVLSHSTLVRLAAVVHFPAALPLAYGVLLAICVRIFWVGGAVVEMTTFANFLVVALILSFAGPVAWHEVSRPSPAFGSQAAATWQAGEATERPDIYVLILDGYGRADVLREQYGLENELIPTLATLGFFVADRATSNYAQTALSVSSTMNGEYVQTLVEAVSHDERDRRLLGDLIGRNRLFTSLKASGYRIRSYASEYPLLRPGGVDERLGPPLPVTEFDFALGEESAFAWAAKRVSLARWPATQLHRRHVLWTLDRLANEPLDDRQEPTLVFAHLLVPHPPFVFNEDGSVRTTQLPVTLHDGPEWRHGARGTGEKYEEGYKDAVRFLNGRIAEIVRGILRRSRRPPIIYIQGDHGPGAGLTTEYSKNTDIRERFGILLAIRLPGGDYRGLTADGTPINAIRFLMNRAIGTGLPVLDNRSYFSTWSRPFDFVEVTDQLRPF